MTRIALLAYLALSLACALAVWSCGPRYQHPRSWCTIACEDGCTFGAKGCGGGATVAPFLCQDHCFEMCHPVIQEEKP